MKPQSKERKERLAAALRENLRRRKAAAHAAKPGSNTNQDSRSLPADSREPATKQP